MEPTEETQGNVSSSVNGNSNIIQEKKPGGWRAMPYILGNSFSLISVSLVSESCRLINIAVLAGNETFERLATFGLLANFMVYLMREFHMEQVTAANVINIWSGITNFAPLIGAFISDSYVGRFTTIAFASCAAFLVSTFSPLYYNLHSHISLNLIILVLLLLTHIQISNITCSI